MIKKNLLLTGLITLITATCLITAGEATKSIPVGITITGENILTDIKPALRDIVVSPDGKKLLLWVGHGFYITDVNNIKKVTYLLEEPLKSYWWSPDSLYIIEEEMDYLIKDKPDDPDSKQINFIVTNINTKEQTTYSLSRKSLSYSEGIWYVIKQDAYGKVTMVHPSDLQANEPLLGEGMMLPYQVTKNIGKRYYEETEEKEIWIRTKHKDFKILDNVGEVRHADLSPKHDRLLISYIETQKLGSKEKAKSYVYDLKTNKLYDLLALTGVESGYEWSPDGEWLIYSKVSKQFELIVSESEYDKIKQKEKAYFDWAAYGNYPVGDIFVVSWDAKNVVQLTKDSEVGKTASFYSPAVWFGDNKIAFLYLTFKYEEMIQVKGENYPTLFHAVPEWGLKIGEIKLKK